MATAYGTTLGEWLKQAREARGLTLDDVTQQTRIPLRHLQAIEQGVFGLPTFYMRAEVRAIARAIGVDEQLALARLDAAVRSLGPKVERPVDVPVPWLRLLLAGGTLAAVFAMAWLAGGERLEQASITPARSAEPQGLAPISLGEASTASPPKPAVEPAPAVTPAPAVDRPPADVTPVPDIPSPPESTTELVVRTRPEGAHVTVNGIGWGVSPVAIRHLPAGDKRIRVSKDGYEAAETVLALDEGRHQAVDIELPLALPAPPEALDAVEPPEP